MGRSNEDEGGDVTRDDVRSMIREELAPLSDAIDQLLGGGDDDDDGDDDGGDDGGDDGRLISAREAEAMVRKAAEDAARKVAGASKATKPSKTKREPESTPEPVKTGRLAELMGWK